MLLFEFAAPPRRPRRLPRVRGVVVVAGVEVSSPVAGVVVVMSVVVAAGAAAPRRPRRTRRPCRAPPALPPPGVNEHLFISPGTGVSHKRSPLFLARTETDCGVPPPAASNRSVAPV